MSPEFDFWFESLSWFSVNRPKDNIEYRPYCLYCLVHDRITTALFFLQSQPNCSCTLHDAYQNNHVPSRMSSKNPMPSSTIINRKKKEKGKRGEKIGRKSTLAHTPAAVFHSPPRFFPLLNPSKRRNTLCNPPPRTDKQTTRIPSPAPYL